MNARETLSGHAQALALVSLAAVLVGGAPPLRAQDVYRPAHNEIYLELAGNTIFGLNYGRTLSRSASVRIGAGLVPEVGVTALLMPTLQLGRNSRHGAEAGLGVQGVWAEGGSFAPAMAGHPGIPLPQLGWLSLPSRVVPDLVQRPHPELGRRELWSRVLAARDSSCREGRIEFTVTIEKEWTR